MNARQMHDRVVAIASEHHLAAVIGRDQVSCACGEFDCPNLFLLDAIRTTVARAWDPFTNTPVERLDGRVR